ncbi:MAG TPA: hypothetical protein VF950_09415 [Planctomycetota bacterium]
MAAKTKAKKPLPRKAMKTTQGGATLNYAKIQYKYTPYDSDQNSPTTQGGITYTGLE